MFSRAPVRPLYRIKWGLANGYQKGLQLDRIDNYKGYSPENCRFVTMKENLANKRPRTWISRPRCKLTADDVRVIRRLIEGGEFKLKEIQERFKISRANLGSIRRRETWVDIY